jgi:hypothetical protein
MHMYMHIAHHDAYSTQHTDSHARSTHALRITCTRTEEHTEEAALERRTELGIRCHFIFYVLNIESLELTAPQHTAVKI